MGRAPTDRRQSNRQPITLIVEYEGSEDLLTDYSENLSTGGVFVNTDYRFNIGEQVRLVLSFPGLLQPCRVTGTVRWSRNTDDECGIGVEFTDETSATGLQDFVQRLRNQDPDLLARRICILIADDNSYVSQLIEEGLRGAGERDFKGRLSFDVLSAGDDTRALALLQEHQVDMLIADGELPTRGATYLLEQLRDKNISCTSLVFSRDEELLSEAREAGAAFTISKPLRLRTLLQSLNGFLGPRENAA